MLAMYFNNCWIKILLITLNLVLNTITLPPTYYLKQIRLKTVRKSQISIGWNTKNIYIVQREARKNKKTRSLTHNSKKIIHIWPKNKSKTIITFLVNLIKTNIFKKIANTSQSYLFTNQVFMPEQCMFACNSCNF